MTYPTPGPYPGPYGYESPPHHRPAWDIALTVLLGVLLVGACGLGFLFSLFAGMATDVCSGNPDRCNFDLVNGAYLAAWGGIGLALLITLAGVIVAAMKKRVMVIWPILGWAIFIVSFAVGAVLLDTGTAMR